MQIEGSKSNHVRLMEETKSLNMDRFDVNTKLEELAGKPETLKKQVGHLILEFAHLAIIYSRMSVCV